MVAIFKFFLPTLLKLTGSFEIINVSYGKEILSVLLFYKKKPYDKKTPRQIYHPTRSFFA